MVRALPCTQQPSMDKTRALLAQEAQRLAQRRRGGGGGAAAQQPSLTLADLFELARSPVVHLPVDLTHLSVLWVLDRWGALTSARERALQRRRV